MRHITSAIFADPQAAEQIATRLAQEGVPPDRIQVLTQGDDLPKTGALAGPRSGPTVGGVAGALLGGLLGLGSINLSGGIVFTEPIVAFGIGASAGAVAGGLVGFLTSPSHDARRYRAQLHEGRAVVAVELEDPTQAPVIESLMQRSGACSSPRTTTQLGRLLPT